MALTNKGNFSIDGIEFKAQSIKISYDSLTSDDSGRTDDGVMHIYWIYRKIRKLTIEMPPCTASDISILFQKVQGRVYNITYYDPLIDGEKTIEVYTSDSSADMYSGVVNNGTWKGIQFNAIQTAGESA